MKGPFVVVGGGTAGWLGALFFKKIYPNEEVIVIESSKIGIIGVGEGSTPDLQKLFNFLNINVLDIVKKADITFKNGAYFVGWDDENFEFNNAFNISCDEYYHASKDLISFFLDRNSKNLFNDINPLYKITLNKDVTFPSNKLPANDYSIHFNNFKMCDALKEIGISRKIKIVDSVVTDVNLKNNLVESVILEDNSKIFGNFFIDSSGFKRLLPSKFNVKFQEFNELLNDSAIPCELPTVIYNPYTECRAMQSGWRWLIPTASRTGSGYVYSSKYISDENAKKEFVNSIKLTNNLDIEPNRIIKFKSGMLENLYFSNVLCIGLCSHFLEPLEATSIAITAQTLFEFNKKHNKEIFNIIMRKKIIQIKDFILLHYLTRKTNSQYWIDAFNIAKNNEFISSILHDLSNHKIISYDVFKDNDNYFGFINHFLFFQKYGIIKKKIKLKDFNFNSIELSFLKKFTSWHQQNIEKAVNYKKFYIQLLNDT